MKLFRSGLRAPANLMILALLGIMVCAPDAVLAKIYKYKDDQGKTHFTDNPNSIPLKYRKENSLKKFRGVVDPSSPPSVAPGTPGQASTGGDGGAAPGSKEDQPFTPQDEALVNKTIKVLQKGVALAERYKGAQPNTSNGRGATIVIQNNLPEKEGLIQELAATKVKALKTVHAFLQKSVAIDKETRGIGTGLKTRIVGILNRIQDDGKQQDDLIKQLEKAMKDSEKKKAEAKKKEAANQQNPKK